MTAFITLVATAGINADFLSGYHSAMLPNKGGKGGGARYAPRATIYIIPHGPFDTHNTKVRSMPVFSPSLTQVAIT